MTTETKLTTGIRHDLFAAIPYEKRSGPNGTVIGLQLGPHFVFKWLVVEAWEHFAASIATANKGKFHSSEDLFNDAQRWAELEKPLHIAIGRCLALFANERNRMLPVSCVNPHQSNKLYGLIGR